MNLRQRLSVNAVLRAASYLLLGVHGLQFLLSLGMNINFFGVQASMADKALLVHGLLCFIIGLGLVKKYYNDYVAIPLLLALFIPYGYYRSIAGDSIYTNIDRDLAVVAVLCVEALVVLGIFLAGFFFTRIQPKTSAATPNRRAQVVMVLLFLLLIPLALDVASETKLSLEYKRNVLEGKTFEEYEDEQIKKYTDGATPTPKISHDVSATLVGFEPYTLHYLPQELKTKEPIRKLLGPGPNHNGFRESYGYFDIVQTQKNSPLGSSREKCMRGNDDKPCRELPTAKGILYASTNNLRIYYIDLDRAEIGIANSLPTKVSQAEVVKLVEGLK